MSERKWKLAGWAWVSQSGKMVMIGLNDGHGKIDNAMRFAFPLEGIHNLKDGKIYARDGTKAKSIEVFSVPQGENGDA